MERFSDILKSRYLFHIHTDYTDAKLSCRDYFEFAYKNDIKTLVFTEHVRKNLNYDFATFVEEIEIISRNFPNIDYKIGVEAKILPGGGLDIPEDILNKIEIICFACHGFPHDAGLYYRSFIKLFKDDRWKEFVRVWVHPGRFLKKNKIIDKEMGILKKLVNFALKEDVFIEDNKRDNLPPKNIIIPDGYYIKGYDIHTYKDLERVK